MPCTTVNVEEPDESSIEISDMSATSNSPNEIDVEFTISNNILSGDGESLGMAYSVTLDGSQVDSGSVSVNPGQNVTRTTRVTGVSAGGHEVCVEGSETVSDGPTPTPD